MQKEPEATIAAQASPYGLGLRDDGRPSSPNGLGYLNPQVA